MATGEKGTRKHAITLNAATPRRFRSKGGRMTVGSMTMHSAHASRRNFAAIHRSAAVFLFVVFLSLTAAPTQACPVCDSETGKHVRRGLFNEDFGKNLLMTVLPFPILLGIVAVIYYGPPSHKSMKG